MSFINNSGPAVVHSKENLIKGVREELAGQRMTSLMTVNHSWLQPALDFGPYANACFQTMHKRCFEKCIPNPGSSISKGEDDCIAQCVQKYMHTLDVVSKQWNMKMQQLSEDAKARPIF